MSERVLAVLLQQAMLLSVGIVLVAALRPLLLKRIGAGVVYAAWLLVPALLLTPLLPRPTQEPLRVVLQATGVAEMAAAPVLPAPDQAAIWLALWLGGAILVAAVQAQRQWRLTRLGERLPPGSSPALVGLLRPRVALPADFEQRFPSAERTLILAHEQVHRDRLDNLCLLRPRVALPGDFEQRFPPAERTLILAHEQVHRDRLDNLWNLLACALTALHWWNPLAWCAARRMQADQELACDAAVLATRPDALVDYTRALLAAHDLTSHGAPLASRWGSHHPLVERISMLNRPQPLNRRGALLLLSAVACVSTLAYAAESPPPAGAGYIELQLMVERTHGGDSPQHKTSIEAKVISQDGRRSELRLNAIPSETKSWATEPLRIGLLVQKQDGAALIKTEIRSGDPDVEIARPNLMAAWGTKARIEINRPESGEKFVLELTPTALPADFQPPKNSF